MQLRASFQNSENSPNAIKLLGRPIWNRSSYLNYYCNWLKRIQNKRLKLQGNPIRKIVILDLDNTLIPTTWIMNTYKNMTNKYNICNLIKAADLITQLALFFKNLYKNGAYEIIVVTNASTETVEKYYLKHWIPQLAVLFDKFDIKVRCTDEFSINKGKPPSTNVNEFFQYYCDIKFLVMNDFFEKIYNYNYKYEFIIIGDQMCEIEAAIKLTKLHSNKITQIKLILLQQQANQDVFNFTNAFKKHISSINIIMQTNDINKVHENQACWSNHFKYLYFCITLPKYLLKGVPIHQEFYSFISKNQV